MTPRLAGRALAVLVSTLAGPALAGGGDPARGAYLANIMHCNGCHTPRGAEGAPIMERFLAGGTIGFEIPGLGVFFPPNLTSDAETGLGAWTDAEIVAAVREGVRRDGRVLAPAMPANDYAMLSDADAADLVAYLRSLPPVVHAVPGPYGPGERAPAPHYTVVLPSVAN